MLRLLATIDMLYRLLPIQAFLELKRLIESSLTTIGEQLLPPAAVLLEDSGSIVPATLHYRGHSAAAKRENGLFAKH